MKVLLRDLDIITRRLPAPNLALMKLSTYHKARGDEVSLNFPLYQPDITYASCVFTWNAKQKVGLPPDAILGGSGINLKAELLPEIEHMMPDYTLYPNVAPQWGDSSIGFTSRGCHRRCPWCIVPDKEGAIKPWASIYEFWDRQHSRLILLDNNLLAAPNWRRTMETLIAEKIRVDFNQGLDIRLLNEENVWYLKRVRAEQLRFAFDDITYERSVRQGIELLLSEGIGSRKLSFYLLVGFPGDNSVVERAKILHSYNVEIYPMAYKGPDGKEPPRIKLEIPNIFWHGSRRNINKFLRLVGRLPE